MSRGDDALVFADEVEPPETERSEQTWKILIVDDEPQVHSVTRLALRDVRFDGGPLEFISAYNGTEARTKMEEHDDVALVLLDIVMETSDSGPKVANYIRHELSNHLVRIILRTGQPGEIPEREVINNYEINDYKTKTDLTAQKLYTVVMTALRSYRDLCLVQENSRAMEWLLDSARGLFEQQEEAAFLQGMGEQLDYFTTTLLDGDVHYWIAQGTDAALTLVGGSGEWAGRQNDKLAEVWPDMVAKMKSAEPGKTCFPYEGQQVLCCGNTGKVQLWVGIEGSDRGDNERTSQLLQLWGQGVSVAFSSLRQSLEQQAQKRKLEKKISQLRDSGGETEALTKALEHQKARRAALIEALKACRRAQRKD